MSEAFDVKDLMDLPVSEEMQKAAESPTPITSHRRRLRERL